MGSEMCIRDSLFTTGSFFTAVHREAVNKRGAAGTTGPRPGPWATESSLQSLRAGLYLTGYRQRVCQQERAGVAKRTEENSAYDGNSTPSCVQGLFLP